MVRAENDLLKSDLQDKTDQIGELFKKHAASRKIIRDLESERETGSRANLTSLQRIWIIMIINITVTAYK